MRTKLLLLLVLLSHALGTVFASAPQLISGTYLAGSNVTEPRPSQSKHFETLHGGVVVIGNVAGFYLFVKVREAPPSPLYVQIEYQDPLGGPSITNDMEFLPTMQELRFSSPSAVRGLRVGAEYKITVKVFEQRHATETLDVLVQTVRSYVDTAGAEPKVSNRIKPFP